jgi:hypothetical protein
VLVWRTQYTNKFVPPLLISDNIAVALRKKRKSFLSQRGKREREKRLLYIQKRKRKDFFYIHTASCKKRSIPAANKCETYQEGALLRCNAGAQDLTVH